ncbi:MAG: SCO family protein [Alphaproteobacteria bacterium]|nr:SCO family protein [Alphaproteobacteria bacterium]
MTIAAVSGVVCLILATLMVVAMLDRGRSGGTAKTIATAVGVEIGGPFRLTDHRGDAVSEADFLGSYLLVYFGYGFCPDVCPTELQNIGVAMDELGADGERVIPIFITVDPERDTVAFMKDYVAAFHPRMVGLTGDPERIAEVAKAYRVYYAKVADEDSADYLMDHTSYVYLMGPDGNFVTMFRYNTPPNEIAAAVRNAF